MVGIHIDSFSLEVKNVISVLMAWHDSRFRIFECLFLDHGTSSLTWSAFSKHVGETVSGRDQGLGGGVVIAELTRYQEPWNTGSVQTQVCGTGIVSP